MLSKKHVRLPREETDHWSCNWGLHVCIPISSHSKGTILKCSDSDTAEVSSLQCCMEDRSSESLFLEERTDEGDGVNHLRVRDNQSLHFAVQKMPCITAYYNSPAHKSSSGGLAFDPCLHLVVVLSHFQFLLASWRCYVCNYMGRGEIWQVEGQGRTTIKILPKKAQALQNTAS